jgi:predicted RNA binding protein YcfA (HicA-like mRNA interferase family)
VRYGHPDGRKTIVPVYGNEELSTGLIKKILKQSRISRKMYEELREKI